MPPKKLMLRSRPSKKTNSQRSLSIVPLARSNNKSRPGLNPIIRSKGRNSIQVQYCEMIAQVSGTSAYAVASFPINPGMALTFPWLRQLAIAYEKYRFQSLGLVFVPICAATASGSIGMSVDYDAADAAPLDMPSLQVAQDKDLEAIWKDCVVNCSKASLSGPERFNRFNDLAANLDIKTYDWGNFHVATDGCSVTSAIGYLYVDYTVELITPQLPDPADFTEDFYVHTHTTDRAKPFDAIQDQEGEIAGVLDDNELYFLTGGSFIISHSITGGTCTDVSPTLTLDGGSVSATTLAFANAAANEQTGFLLIRNVPRGAHLTVDCTACAASITGLSWRIARYNLS